MWHENVAEYVIIGSLSWKLEVFPRTALRRCYTTEMATVPAAELIQSQELDLVSHGDIEPPKNWASAVFPVHKQELKGLEVEQLGHEWWDMAVEDRGLVY